MPVILNHNFQWNRTIHSSRREFPFLINNLILVCLDASHQTNSKVKVSFSLHLKFYYILEMNNVISIPVHFIFQFFGFVAMCAYGYDAWLKYQQYNTVVTNVVTRTTTVTAVA